MSRSGTYEHLPRRGCYGLFSDRDGLPECRYVGASGDMRTRVRRLTRAFRTGNYRGISKPMADWFRELREKGQPLAVLPLSPNPEHEQYYVEVYREAGHRLVNQRCGRGKIRAEHFRVFLNWPQKDVALGQ